MLHNLPCTHTKYAELNMIKKNIPYACTYFKIILYENCSKKIQ